MIKLKPIIGRTDCVDFPSLKIKNIRVKIDTGAYTSSIHCHDIKVVKRNDKKVLRFYLLDPTHPEYEGKALYSANFKQKNVRSSNGQNEKRYIIPAQIKIQNQVYQIDLSLTDRGSMKYPVLIGRKFLTGKFIVDVSRYDILASKVKKGK